MVHGRNAVLPFAPCGRAQQVSRSRLEDQRCAPPAVTLAPAKAEGARRRKRDADDLAELGFVLVPADGGAWTILGDEHVLQLCRRNAGEAPRLCAQRFEKVGDLLARL